MAWPRRLAALLWPSKDPRDYRREYRPGAGRSRPTKRTVRALTVDHRPVMRAVEPDSALAGVCRYGPALQVQVLVHCPALGGRSLAHSPQATSAPRAGSSRAPHPIDMAADQRAWNFTVAMN